MKAMKWQEPKLIPMSKPAHGAALCYPGSAADNNCFPGHSADTWCFMGDVDS